MPIDYPVPQDFFESENEIVPGKIIAMRGPVDLGGAMYTDNPKSGIRTFSPAYLIEILQPLGVSDVVRLNGAEYDARAFEEAGLRRTYPQARAANTLALPAGHEPCWTASEAPGLPR
jgi:hypothetical protein